MPAPRFQSDVLEVIDLDARARGRSTATWTRTSRHGVACVERAPGVARDVASRPEPAPPAPNPRAARMAATAERDAAVYAALEHATAAEVAVHLGVSRNQVLGTAYRHRQRHGLQPRATPAASAALVRREALVAALATLPVAVVAERHAVSRSTVRDAARCVGLLLPRAVPPPRPHRDTLITSGTVRLPLIDVGVGQCRSLGNDSLCCCAPTRPGTSWCPGHYGLYTRTRSEIVHV